MRDSQRSKLYSWERKAIRPHDTTQLTLAECQSLVRDVAHLYDIPVPQVTDGRGRRSACWSDGQNQIKLPKWARTMNVTLHEAAHYVIDRYPPYELQKKSPHGELFLRVFIALVAQFRCGIWSEHELIESARKYGLKVANLSATRPPRMLIQEIWATRKYMEMNHLSIHDPDNLGIVLHYEKLIQAKHGKIPFKYDMLRYS